MFKPDCDMSLRQYAFKMNKQERFEASEPRLRDRLLPFFYTHVEKALLPLGVIEVIGESVCYLQVFKYPIDHFSRHWFGRTTAFFLWLDPSYYTQFVSEVAFDVSLIVTLLLMLTYLAVPLMLQLFWPERTHLQANVMRVAYLVVKNVLLVPIVGMTLGTLNCEVDVELHSCVREYGAGLEIGVLFFLALWLVFLAGQAFSSYDFLLYPTHFVHVKKSAMTSVALIVLVLLNEIGSFFGETLHLVVLHLTAPAMLIMAIVLEQYHSQFFRLLEIAIFAVMCFAVLFLDAIMVLGAVLPVPLMPILSVLLFLGVMQLRTYSIDFELKNVNKWPTSEVMMRYAYTLRWFLSRREEPLAAAHLYGYMEIHRQKCDNPSCPSRVALDEKEEKLFSAGKWPRSSEQFLRVDNIIKKIWGDGYRLSPISTELQLQNATFLYERGEKELALRTLLKINQDKLPLSRIYWFARLRDKIQNELKESPEEDFLDLLSDLQIKQREREIFRLFEKAALLNLQFWSHLNQDYPDFSKFNEAALAKVRVRAEITRSFEEVSRIANNERVTTFYANYLEMIENDESGVETIARRLTEKYALGGRIRLQDWGNTSECMMLVSIEDGNYGEIVELNTSCASALGFKKHEMVHQNIRNMLLEELRRPEELRELLGVGSNGAEFYLTHRNGYQVLMRKHSQIYNSMGTGITAILTLTYDPVAYQCHLILDREQRVVGATPSLITTLGVELKTLDAEPRASEFFTFPLSSPPDVAVNYQLEELVNRPFFNPDKASKQKVRVMVERVRSYWRVVVEFLLFGSKNTSKYSCRLPMNQFKFGVEATLDSFHFLGTPTFAPKMKLEDMFEGLKTDHKIGSNQRHNYAQGISLLRLRDNVVVMVDEENPADLEDFGGGRQEEEGSQVALLSQAAELEIFSSHDSFEKFVGEHRVGGRMLWVLVLSMAFVVAVDITFFALNSASNRAITNEFRLTAYQNLILGGAMKQRWQMTNLNLMAANLSQKAPQDYLSSYNDNRLHLESILLLGREASPLELSYNNVTERPLSSIFLQTLINYANAFAAPITSAPSLADLTAALGTLNDYQQSYLGNMSYWAATEMYQGVLGEELTTHDSISTAMTVDLVNLVGGILGAAVMIATLLGMVHLINLERQGLLEIFLELSEHTTQVMGAKCEKFLVSLHNEEGIEGGEEDEVKKSSSATMSKRKRFKEVRFDKGIYLKLGLLPLLYCGFVIHAYVLSSANLTFQHSANFYVRLTASGDYEFYSVMARFGEQLLAGDQSAVAEYSELRDYYRDYLSKHYASYGNRRQFHLAFMDILVGNVCAGEDTPYGNTSLPVSCSLTLFYEKGIYQIMSEVLAQLQRRQPHEPLNEKLMTELEVLSKAHRKLTGMLLQAGDEVLQRLQDQLLEALLIWVGVGVLAGLLVGVPIVKHFLDEVNEVKSVIAGLPVSLARGLNQVRNYTARIMEERN